MIWYGGPGGGGAEMFQGEDYRYDIRSFTQRVFRSFSSISFFFHFIFFISCGAFIACILCYAMLYYGMVRY